MADHESFLETLDTPSLIVDGRILERNLDFMADVARKNNVSLRPHIKTHKCPELARRQLEKGATGIAVAKVTEAQVMAAAGLRDIQIANEVVAPSKLRKLIQLLETTRMTIIVDNRQNVDLISRMMAEAGKEIEVLIDINVGLNRTGLSQANPRKILNFASYLNKKRGINFEGIMTHAGQVYHCTTIKEVEKVGLFEGRRMVELAGFLKKGGHP